MEARQLKRRNRVLRFRTIKRLMARFQSAGIAKPLQSGDCPNPSPSSSVAPKFPEKPSARQAPLTFDGSRRAVHNVCGFLNGQPGEKTQLYDAGVLRIECGQPLERKVDSEDVLRLGPMVSVLRSKVEGNARCRVATLSSVVCTRVIYKDAPHKLRGQSKEMCPIFHGHPSLIYEAHVELVDKGCRNERVIGTFTSQLASGDAPQLAVYDGQKLFECCGIPLGPSDEELSQVSWTGRGG